MSAVILDGKALAARITDELKERAARLAEHSRKPGLAVILVGDDPASNIYVRNKIRACEKVGIESLEYRLPASTSEEALLAQIRELNENPAVDGILVQLPLPAHISSEKVIATISPEKDVDGFHVQSAGALMTGRRGFLPCTPYGVMKIIDSAGYDLKGKHAVVVGRSNIVGKPQALLLLSRHATVTITHSKTPDLAAFLKQADVVVAAVGRAKLITGDMLKPGALVIDVGMNRDENGKLCGDVDFESAREVAGWITPAMLMTNTVEAAEKHLACAA